MALLTQPRPKLWNRNRKLGGVLNIVLQKLFTSRPYLAYEKGIKTRKKDFNYIFSLTLCPSPNLSFIEYFGQYK